MEKMNEVQENEATYELVRPKVAKEKFNMEDNNCYNSFQIAPKVALKVVSQKTKAVYMTNRKYFTGSKLLQYWL